MELAIADWKLDELREKKDEPALGWCTDSWSITHHGREVGRIGQLKYGNQWMSFDLEGHDKNHRSRIGAIKHLVAKKS